MKIDRIRVRIWAGNYHDMGNCDWCAYDKQNNELFDMAGWKQEPEVVIAEARWLSKKLGCKLVLPEVNNGKH